MNTNMKGKKMLGMSPSSAASSSSSSSSPHSRSSSSSADLDLNLNNNNKTPPSLGGGGGPLRMLASQEQAEGQEGRTRTSPPGPPGGGGRLSSSTSTLTGLGLSSSSVGVGPGPGGSNGMIQGRRSGSENNLRTSPLGSGGGYFAGSGGSSPLGLGGGSGNTKTTMMKEIKILPGGPEPCPPRRIPPVPTPFDMEMPKFLVPDVSLILGPDGFKPNLALSNNKTCETENNENHMMTYRNPLVPTAPTTSAWPRVTSPPEPVQYRVDDKIPAGVATELFAMIKRQAEILERLERKMENLLGSQKVTASCQCQSKTKPNLCDRDTQTDEPVPLKAKSPSLGMEKTTLNKSPVIFEKILPPKPSPRPLPLPEKSRGSNNDSFQGTEDFSTILKDLQLPTIHEHSNYSADNSIRFLDELQDYNDTFMNSVSTFESSSDEDFDEVLLRKQLAKKFSPHHNYERTDKPDELWPPMTRKTAVMPMLPPPAAPPLFPVPAHLQDPIPSFSGHSDTTVFGMSSANLSFATKQYLERHGLFKSGKGNRNHFQQQEPYGKYYYGNQPLAEQDGDRILDIASLKNQPKLL